MNLNKGASSPKASSSRVLVDEARAVDVTLGNPGRSRSGIEKMAALCARLQSHGALCAENTCSRQPGRCVLDSRQNFQGNEERTIGRCHHGFYAGPLLEQAIVVSDGALTDGKAECTPDLKSERHRAPIAANHFPSITAEQQGHVSSTASLPPVSVSSKAFLPQARQAEINKAKNIRRNQRDRAKWLQRQQTSNSNLSTDDESDNTREKESHICAVCLDVFFNPYMCYPCHHIFCEPCLRTLAKDNPSNTPCPLCRTTIAKVLFQTALNKSTIACFPNEYFKRKHSFQRTSCARWPLPCCKKVFRVFGGGFSRLREPFTRRQFPHSTHRLDSTDFEDNSHGWRFDVDMMIIYIFSVNWVIGFIIFCFLCYFFFPSF